MIPELTRLDLEKLSGTNFSLLDAERMSMPLSRGCIADFPFLRTLLVFRQNSSEPSFREEINSFVLLVQINVAASRTPL